MLIFMSRVKCFWVILNIIFSIDRVANLFSFLCVCFVCLFACLFVFVLCLVYPMSPLSLDCPFVIGPSVLSHVYLDFFIYMYGLCIGICHDCSYNFLLSKTYCLLCWLDQEANDAFDDPISNCSVPYTDLKPSIMKYILKLW
jgi:hypothetical protein